MIGGAGIDAVSSAQSRRVGTGVKYSGMGLNEGSSRGGGSKTAAGGVLDTLVVARDTGGGEADCLWGSGVSWVVSTVGEGNTGV